MYMQQPQPTGGFAAAPTSKPLIPPPTNTGVVPPPTAPTMQTMQTMQSPTPAPTPSSAPPPLIPPQPASNSGTNYSGGQYGSVNGIDPVKVKSTELTGMQPYIDAAYSQSASRLDPQFQQMESRFQQDMVNKGIQPGTQAYDEAYGNFTRSKNDAYAGARNDAMGQGLAAQGQAWGQGMNQAQLAQAMQMYGLNRDQFDVSRYSTLAGLDQSAFGLNQNANAQQFNMGQSLLGMIPNSGASQIDTYSPYQMQQSSINQQNANAAAQQNGMWGAVGTMGAAAIPLICARELKEEIAVADPMVSLSAVESLPLSLWKYREGEDQQPHLGTYAEEFNKSLGLENVPHINLIDIIGSLIGSVQALSVKVKQLESGNALRSN